MFTRPVVVLALLLTSGAVSAQGFDPAKVDWEKLAKIPMQDFFIRQFNDKCGSCHGEDLRGTTLGPPLVGVALRHGDSVQAITRSIAAGYPDTGMPGWSATLPETQVYNLALYVAEQRQGTTILDKRANIDVALPEGPVSTARARFRVESVASGLDPLPFAIAPLPDGRLLLTERTRGLSIIGRDGSRTLVKGTPAVSTELGSFLGQVVGFGWMLDVALDPDYRRNGWIYLHHTDRCTDCNELARKTKRPVSMNRIVRGRIRGDAWVDEEVLWTADKTTYTDTTDLAAAGRLALDDRGYLYFTVGMKAALDWQGIQDLSLPYGKIHRIHTDGRIPDDNPFVNVPNAVKSTWSYGHRSAQGLFFDRKTRTLWSTEMGPRGGDELNRVERGANYGWPVFTNGINYDGRPVNGAKLLNSSLKPEETVFPLLDLTPAQGISNLIVYRGRKFRGWDGAILVGTLRATDLLRVEAADGAVAGTEVLLKDVARVRDVAEGPKGEVYLLLENAAGSRIVRLVPAGRA